MNFIVVLAMLAIGLPASIVIVIIYALAKIAVMSERTRELVQENEVDNQQFNTSSRENESTQVSDLNYLLYQSICVSIGKE